ncbi:MAG: TolC family protein [Spirochaetaceae bacterium]|nr:TolC family protein [Spirochaetaceae bacterium]
MLALAVFSIASAPAEPIPFRNDPTLIPTLSLPTCISAALSSGDEIAIAERTLAAARAGHAVTAAKQGLSLSATGSYGATLGLGDSSQAKRAGSADGLGLAQSFSGGLSLSQGTQSSTSPFSRLSLTATQGLPPAASSSSAATSVGVSLAQTIWDGYPGGQTRAVVEKSLLALRGKELAASQARSAAVARAKLAYVTMLSAQRVLELRKGSLERQRAMLRQIEAVYALEQASSLDLASASINLRAAELDLRSAEKDLRTARQRLALLIGFPVDQEFAVAEVEDARLPVASVEEAVSTGLAKRTDAAQLELLRESAGIDLALARAQGGASLSLSAGFNAALGWGAAPAVGEAASLGFRVALPLFDAGAAQSQVDAGTALAEIHAIQLRQLRKSIATDIADCYETALIQAERADVAKSSMELAQAQFEVVRTQNEYGTTTNQDLLTASVAAATAAAAHASARSAYLTAVLQLETAMGL